MASIDREHPEFAAEIQRRERLEEQRRMDHKYGAKSVTTPPSYKQSVGRTKRGRQHVTISFGKCWESDTAPNGWRFQTPYGMQHVFNEITGRYRSARDAPKRFTWDGTHKFWYTQDQGSAEEAKRKLLARGLQVDGGP